MVNPEDVKNMIESSGGKVNEVMLLPDGHGCMTASFPLPKDHWLTVEPEGFNVPPMGLRDLWLGFARNRAWSREDLNMIVRQAARYAIRASTMNGREQDFDPDAMVQNMVVGLLGYHTPNGLSGDEWANPSQEKR